MEDISSKFQVNHELLAYWKSKSQPSQGVFSFWRLKYHILLIIMITAASFLGLSFWLTIGAFMVVFSVDYLAYRKVRRFLLTRETKLLADYLDKDLGYVFYKESQIGDYERKDIKLFGKRKVSQVNPIHYIRKLVVRSLCSRKEFNGRQLLDIGCHYGVMTEEFTGAWLKITAMDLQRHTMPEFKRRLGISPVVANARHLPFKSGHIDGISFMEIVEHLTDPVSILKELHSILPKGGKLLLTTNNRHEIHWEYFLNPLKLLEKALGLITDNILPIRPILWRGFDDKLFYYHTAFSKKEITAVLKSCGFRIILMSTFAYANNLYELFNKLGIDITEQQYANLQIFIGKFLDKMPIIRYLGAHWLIIAKKK
jgi:SAM-dependent methyltransferase